MRHKGAQPDTRNVECYRAPTMTDNSRPMRGMSLRHCSSRTSDCVSSTSTIPPCSDDPAPNVTCKPKNPQLIDQGVEGGNPYRVETSVASGSYISSTPSCIATRAWRRRRNSASLVERSLSSAASVVLCFPSTSRRSDLLLSQAPISAPIAKTPPNVRIVVNVRRLTRLPPLSSREQSASWSGAVELERLGVEVHDAAVCLR
jgi:hypothetical protein